jgi:hypothetical protein
MNRFSFAWGVCGFSLAERPRLPGFSLDKLGDSFGVLAV